MSDETVNRILDMIESIGVAVLPIAIVLTILFLSVSAVALFFIIKVIKDIWSDR